MEGEVVAVPALNCLHLLDKLLSPRNELGGFLLVLLLGRVFLQFICLKVGEGTDHYFKLLRVELLAIREPQLVDLAVRDLVLVELVDVLGDHFDVFVLPDLILILNVDHLMLLGGLVVYSGPGGFSLLPLRLFGYDTETDVSLLADDYGLFEPEFSVSNLNEV